MTLYHFECPQALVDAFGGWLDRQMIDHYLRYAEGVFQPLQGPGQAVGHRQRQLIATAAGIMNGNHETDPPEKSAEHLPDELPRLPGGAQSHGFAAAD